MAKRRFLPTRREMPGYPADDSSLENESDDSHLYSKRYFLKSKRYFLNSKWSADQRRQVGVDSRWKSVECFFVVCDWKTAFVFDLSSRSFVEKNLHINKHQQIECLVLSFVKWISMRNKIKEKISDSFHAESLWSCRRRFSCFLFIYERFLLLETKQNQKHTNRESNKLIRFNQQVRLAADPRTYERTGKTESFYAWEWETKKKWELFGTTSRELLTRKTMKRKRSWKRSRIVNNEHRNTRKAWIKSSNHSINVWCELPLPVALSNDRWFWTHRCVNVDKFVEPKRQDGKWRIVVVSSILPRRWRNADEQRSPTRCTRTREETPCWMSVGRRRTSIEWERTGRAVDWHLPIELTSFERRQGDTERIKMQRISWRKSVSESRTAIFENVVPTIEKKRRGCVWRIWCGEANAHQVDEKKSMAGEINGRMASMNVRLYPVLFL